MMRRILFSLLIALTTACGVDDADDFGIDEELVPVGPMGKDDGPGKAGLKVATDTSRTQVWVARNKWEDRDTPAARRAGLAWGENSGLNWDEKFTAWVASLESTDAHGGGYRTVKLTTPWGKTVPAPVLECAETAIFLRATFAAWYELPFFMEARTAGGQRVYFGHFGIRTATGRYANTPEFAIAYKDYSSWTAGDLATKGWPKDATLRARRAAGGADGQPFLGGDATAGTYLDEVHLNKRAGHLIIYLLNFFGSAHLADAANTYNLVPDAIRPGDMLLHRWQKTGIGDTKILWQVTRHGDGVLAARLMSGSMPRRQPKIYDEVASKSYFTSNDTGGVGTSADGTPYWKLGGGVKRWRVTKNVGGHWTNTWMAADEASWINDQDEARISARPAQFERLLVSPDPESLRTALVQVIEDNRAHLMKYPASCAARERRERAFRQLYELAPRLGWTRARVDEEYRRLEDYVFAELVYPASKTCCWNSTTPAMADLIMDYAEAEQRDACVVPTVFRAEDGGYERWRAYAASVGRAAEWRAWSEDEPCAQRAVANDTVAPQEWTPWCEVDATGPGGGACTDAFEPNDAPASARAVTPGATISGRVCAGDRDHFAVTVPAGGAVTARLTFSHAAGDLDLELLGPTGQRLALSETITNEEVVSASGLAAGTYVLHVYGYNGATGEYALSVSGS